MANKKITITAMAKHLFLSSAFIRKLVADGVIERQSDGQFDESATRKRYLHWLRERRSPSAANSEFRRLRTHEIALRIEKIEGGLIPLEDSLGMIAEVAAIAKAEMIGLPQRVTRDRQLLRQIEDEVTASLHRMSAKAAAMARSMKG